MSDISDDHETMALDDRELALGRQLCFAVYSAAHAFTRAYKPMLDRLGLTYPQYLVMLALWQGDGLAVKQLGDELGLDSGTLSPLLKRLETGGFVDRRRDTADERQVIVRLTQKGRDLKREAFGIFEAIGRASGCAPEDVGPLRDSLHKLRSGLDASRQPNVGLGPDVGGEPDAGCERNAGSVPDAGSEPTVDGDPDGNDAISANAAIPMGRALL